MNTSLLIMAAGIGSRFGDGIKQLVTIDSEKHIIMDYSIHDAIKVGFNKIVFIIRKDIEDDFRTVIGDRIETICKGHGVVDYVFQSLEQIPGKLLAERKKTWGTGQAVLVEKEIIDTPFMVINADDYYGKEAFVKIHDWLCENYDKNASDFCMAGFILKNSLSNNGGVTRGICKTDKNGYLTDIVETSKIIKKEAGAEVEGKVVDAEAYVSMNMWGLTRIYGYT